MDYTELKSWSYYSFLRGASPPAELIRTAIRLGLRGLALTDVGGVYGLPKAYQAWREAGEPDFRLISGSEILLKDQPGLSVSLLAPNRLAYGAMCRLLTRSHAGEAKGTGALTLEQLVAGLQELPGGSELLLFPEWQERFLNERNPDHLLADWERLGTLVNPLYLPLRKNLDGLDAERSAVAHKLSQALRAPLTAVQGVCFAERKDRMLQDVLTSVREGQPLRELGFKLARNSERVLKSGSEMARLFADLPDAIGRTMEVRERCAFSLSELRYRYPDEWIPKPHSAQSWLRHLCEAGLPSRYPDGVPDAVRKQLEHELKLIEELSYADYFLTVQDMVDFARKRGILCQGRGSAANSVVCFVLGITAIDPVRMNLLFERFISTERGEPPDIDVDFEHERREEVIQYLYQKYGRDRAAMVSAVVTYRSRSALREVAKAFSLPVGTLSARKVQNELIEAPELSDSKRSKILEVVERLEGYPRHLSIHSGGFTLSSEPLDTLVPIEPATMEGRTIIQWDKYDLDILGLLKIDVLALGMLTAIQKCLEFTGRELHRIPSEDRATYDMICKADTIGVFQIESRAQMSMLPRLRPRTFYDLVVEVALVRPGPIVGNMVHPYLRRRRGEEPVWLPDPRLVPILGRTYGVPIFQEQVMKMAVTLAGFTPGEADRLRKAIGAWRSSGSIGEMGLKLQHGLKRAGIPDAFAARIFEQIQGFSEYGFPESHAASFALLTYVSSYFKCHHPAEFLCALLNSQPMGFYSPHSLVDDAKRHGVEVLPVSVSESEWDSTLDGARIVRLGLRFVKGLSEKGARNLIEARRKRAFLSFQDLVSRTDLSLRDLRALARSDAFAGLRIPLREALFRVLTLHEGLFNQEGVQVELFPSTALPRMSAEEAVIQDYDATGLSARGHPMKFLRERLKRHPRMRRFAELTTAEVKTFRHRSEVTIPGLSVVLQRPPTAKGTAFATIEDESGILDLILHREVFEKFRDVIRDEAFLLVRGELQRDREAVQLVVRRIDPIFSDLEIPVAPGAHARR